MDAAGMRGDVTMAGQLESLRELAPGLSIWRVRHGHWHKGDDWDAVVTTTMVQARGEVALLDPIAPTEQEGADAVWRRLDRSPPTMVVILKADHVRDADLFARRYVARVFGPGLYWRDDLPTVPVHQIYPGMELPGGMMALSDGRWGQETPLWLPDHRTLVFADALTERRERLRVWSTPWDEEGPLRTLRSLLRLPFDRVIISHGEPVHDRGAYIQALDAPPWTTPALREWARQVQPYRELLGLGPWWVDEDD